MMKFHLNGSGTNDMAVVRPSNSEIIFNYMPFTLSYRVEKRYRLFYIFQIIKCFCRVMFAIPILIRSRSFFLLYFCTVL